MKRTLLFLVTALFFVSANAANIKIKTTYTGTCTPYAKYSSGLPFALTLTVNPATYYLKSPTGTEISKASGFFTVKKGVRLTSYAAGISAYNELNKVEANKSVEVPFRTTNLTESYPADSFYFTNVEDISRVYSQTLNYLGLTSWFTQRSSSALQSSTAWKNTVGKNHLWFSGAVNNNRLTGYLSIMKDPVAMANGKKLYRIFGATCK